MVISHAIIDIRMPRKNGFDLITELAPHCLNIHFILLTALNHADVRDRYSLIRSANPSTRISLLFKPIDCYELKKLISGDTRDTRNINPTNSKGRKESFI